MFEKIYSFNRDSSSNLIIDHFKNVNYKEFRNLIENFSNLIKSSKIILIIGSNSINCIAFYIACLKGKAIPLLLPNTIKPFQISDYIRRFSPYAIYSEKKLNLNSKKKLFFEYSFFYFLSDSNNLVSKYPYLLLTTSGSTGSPKVVVVSKENLYSNTDAIINYLKISSKDKHISSLPMNYTYGLSCLNTHLVANSSIVLTNNSLLSNEYWKLFKASKPSTFAGVPYSYEIICKLGLNKLPLNSIEKFTQAGGKLSEKYLNLMIEYIKKNDKEFFVMYGQTEATARMSYLPSKKLQDKIGSIGIPIPNGEFTIDFKMDYPKHKGYQIGELIYRGPNVTSGYAKNFHDLEKHKSPAEELRTGDLAYKDNDNHYYICGRINRFAKINGYRISLDDIQNIILEKYPCAIVSDDKYIYVFSDSLIFKTLPESNKKLLKKIILKKVDINPTLIKFKYIKSIPKNNSGKIIYGDLI